MPPHYHPLPRPTPTGHPVQPVGGPHPLKTQTLIAVDRGPEATTLTPRVGATPKTLMGGEASARMLPKTQNPTVLAYGRPERPASGQPTNEHAPYGLSGGQQPGNIPVYRPTAPVARSGSAAPAYSGHPSGGSSPSFSAPSSAGSYHGSSAPSAPTAPSGGSPSVGGGHPR